MYFLCSSDLLDMTQRTAYECCKMSFGDWFVIIVFLLGLGPKLSGVCNLARADASGTLLQHVLPSNFPLQQILALMAPA